MNILSNFRRKIEITKEFLGTKFSKSLLLVSTAKEINMLCSKFIKMFRRSIKIKTMSLIEKEYNNVMKKLLTKAYICTYAFKLLKVFMEILIYLKYLCKASSKSGFILF